jgi:transcriptional regulator with XRE-family HTH domain
MRELDKRALGRRIRQIRLAAGLRQWELARRLGTTQSAIHKYEHGVIPEPRRLVELARLGGTSVEWVLTGEHWENGSAEQARVPAEALRTACLLRELGQENRRALDEALRILSEAVRALGALDEGPPSPEHEAVVVALRDHAEETLRLLQAALRIQRAVLNRVAREAGARLELESDAPPEAS